MKLNVEELAREAGAELYAETVIVNGKDAHDFVEAFARLIVERCAVECEDIQRNRTERTSSDDYDDEDKIYLHGQVSGAEDCAESIRNLLEEK